MSRAAGLCKRCGGPKRGRAARVSAPIAQCNKCGDDICARHAVWAGDFYICSRCNRAIGKRLS
jgi:formylmethanofuran dehydrogenase subunit E